MKGIPRNSIRFLQNNHKLYTPKSQNGYPNTRICTNLLSQYYRDSVNPFKLSPTLSNCPQLNSNNRSKMLRNERQARRSSRSVHKDTSLVERSPQTAPDEFNRPLLRAFAECADSTSTVQDLSETVHEFLAALANGERSRNKRRVNNAVSV